MYAKVAPLFDNTNLELLRIGKSSFKDMAKALWFQGVVILVNHVEFSKQYELWSTLGSHMSLEIGRAS